LGALSELGIRPEIDAKLFQETQAMDYREDHAQTFLQAIVQVDLLLKQFRGELREETSEVQIFPHHFDLSFAWFSGRLVPGRDPRDAENADEQMTFGFSTGDEGTPDPYFYATAYPLPEGFLAKPLPEPASWHLEGWKGALLPYSSWVNQPDPQPRLLDFLRQAQKAGASLMK
jgi:hypothetical protein